MIEKIHDHVLWFPAPRVLVAFCAYHNVPHVNDIRYLADLILCASVHEHDKFHVHKNRHISLEFQVPRLNQVWQNYQIMDDGWRGAVKVDQAELLQMRLTWL